MSLSRSQDYDDNVSDTISPLSEQSLSSPVEDTGGYQSEVTSSVSCYRICWFIFCFQNKIKPRCDFRSLAGLKMVFWGQGRVEERSKFMFLWSFINNNKIRWLFVIGTSLMQLIITMKNTYSSASIEVQVQVLLWNVQVQYQGGYQQYSSQDSLPDSPYSSQSLDSHAGQTTGSGNQDILYWWWCGSRLSLDNLMLLLRQYSHRQPVIDLFLFSVSVLCR